MKAGQRLTREQARTRDARIVSEVLAGRTLESVGEEYDMTRERVRQIVKREAPGFDVRRARSARATQRRAAVEAKRRAALEGYRRSHAPQRGKSGLEWSEAEMLMCMREMFETHGPLSISKWRAISRGELVPSAALYVSRFGSWNEAKRRAGLTATNARPLSTYHPQYSDDELIDAVATFLRSANTDHGWFGAQHYDRWRQEHGGPSLSLLRVRLGRWSTIKARAIARNEAQR